jgi:hypothetical protein
MEGDLLEARVVALINSRLGDGLTGADTVSSFRQELHEKLRSVESRYEIETMTCLVLVWNGGTRASP